MKKIAVFLLSLLAISFPVLGTFSLAYANGQDYSGNEDPNKKVLKEAVVGAGSGAIAAGASGGKAGKGALIGAGTTVIGSAVLDSLMSSPKPQPQYQQVPAGGGQPHKKIIRHYDADGKVVSEEEAWE